MLTERYTALGRSVEAASSRAEMEEKAQELQETAEAAVAKVEMRNAELAASLADLQHTKIPNLWHQALESGFPARLLDGCLRRGGSSSSSSSSRESASNDAVSAWLDDIQKRYAAAREQEIAERGNRYVVAQSDPGLEHTVLLGNEVLPMLSREEVSISTFRQAVEGVAGSRATGLAASRLKAALQELNSGLPGTPASLPPSSHWVLSVPPDRALPRRIVVSFLSKTESADAASAVAKGLLQQTEDSTVGILQLRRALNSAAKKMEARSQAFAKQVGGHATGIAILALGRKASWKCRCRLLAVWNPPGPALCCLS
ncbi:hypothetical protein DUNSADRAFT_1018 [Dunaliella salina]|uniref:Uncharacterized protein n=1 Tax=Dunaliella salina TaxID=3046 RepID=A0ABQ7GXK5_DUNSA|nr:hypothetical protein DUNSADRAFT_1018 [Dunaliella salina]|eukprot:KAF5839334.1 hypothetical protein DUNSADRAFT_1018 [Dunaliella salina]